jgi:hypothetical protein
VAIEEGMIIERNNTTTLSTMSRSIEQYRFIKPLLIPTEPFEISYHGLYHWFYQSLRGEEKRMMLSLLWYAR